jgi:hypothetical protein
MASVRPARGTPWSLESHRRARRRVGPAASAVKPCAARSYLRLGRLGAVALSESHSRTGQSMVRRCAPPPLWQGRLGEARRTSPRWLDRIVYRRRMRSRAVTGGLLARRAPRARLVALLLLAAPLMSLGLPSSGARADVEQGAVHFL